MTLRVVADTNVIVSAVLWQGIPGQLIAAAIEGEIELFTSQMLADLADRHRAEEVGEGGASRS